MTCTGLNEIVRTFTATDACGNTAFATQVITFADDEAPMGSVEDATVACADYDESMEYGAVEFSDNCSAAVAVSGLKHRARQTACPDVSKWYASTLHRRLRKQRNGDADHLGLRRCSADAE